MSPRWCIAPDVTHIDSTAYAGRGRSALCARALTLCHLSSCDTPDILSCRWQAWLLQLQEVQKASYTLESGPQTSTAKTIVPLKKILLSILPLSCSVNKCGRAELRIHTNIWFSVFLVNWKGAISPPHILSQRNKTFFSDTNKTISVHSSVCAFPGIS